MAYQEVSVPSLDAILDRRVFDLAPSQPLLDPARASFASAYSYGSIFRFKGEYSDRQIIWCAFDRYLDSVIALIPFILSSLRCSDCLNSPSFSLSLNRVSFEFFSPISTPLLLA